MNSKRFIPVLVTALALCSCAKAVSVSTGEKAREYLSLWMEEFHPGVEPQESGLYILEDVPGTGAAWNGELAYTSVGVTIRQLGGTISSTTDEKLAKQLGTYSKANYYGPKWVQTGEGYSYAGVDALLEGMRQGGSRTAVVPAWMLTTSRYSTQAEYIAACSSSTSLIYTITMDRQVSDIDQEEKRLVDSYVHTHFGPSEPARSYNGGEADGTFYFVSDSTAFIGTPMHPTDTTLTLNYTGMRLDGQIFDTTIERVARDAGIYSNSRTYEPVSITCSSTWSNIQLGGSSSLVNGFKGGLYLMKYDGQKATIIFTSSHGYQTSGSGDVIPAWCPLRFDLEFVEQ